MNISQQWNNEGTKLTVTVSDCPNGTTYLKYTLYVTDPNPVEFSTVVNGTQSYSFTLSREAVGDNLYIGIYCCKPQNELDHVIYYNSVSIDKICVVRYFDELTGDNQVCSSAVPYGSLYTVRCDRDYESFGYRVLYYLWNDITYYEGTEFDITQDMDFYAVLEKIETHNVSVFTSDGWIKGISHYWDGSKWVKCKINTL